MSAELNGYPQHPKDEQTLPKDNIPKEKDTNQNYGRVGNNIMVPASFAYDKYPHIMITASNIKVEKNFADDTPENVMKNKNPEMKRVIKENDAGISFILPLTMAVQDGNTFTWSEQAAGESLKDFPKIAGNEIMKNFGGFIKSLVTGGSGETVEGKVMEVAGSTLMYKSRLMPDDFLKQLYSGHDFRKFSFNFTFVAGNKYDAENIALFIKTMEYLTLPAKGGTLMAVEKVLDMSNDAIKTVTGLDIDKAWKAVKKKLPKMLVNAAENVGEAIDGLTSWIQYPCWFKVQFIMPIFDGETEIATDVRELFKTTVMACESFMVQYGSDENGIRVTKDGIPIEYKITMSFVEVYRKFMGESSENGYTFS